MLKKKKKQENNKKKNSTILPPTKKMTPTTPQTEASHGNSQGIGAVTVVAKTSIPEAIAILDFLHFYVSAT